MHNKCSEGFMWQLAVEGPEQDERAERLLPFRVHHTNRRLSLVYSPNPLLRRTEAARPRCRQNEKSMKRREKPRAVTSCDMMPIMRDGVLEF